jgi:parallel beta-helix repeat protein
LLKKTYYPHTYDEGSEDIYFSFRYGNSNRVCYVTLLGRIRMKNKMTLFVFLCILIVTPLFGLQIGLYHNVNTEQNNLWTVSYTDSSSILIEHDDNFTALGFSGDGSEGDPYIIEDLNITSNLPCIEIRNTRAYFEIINCLFASETDDYSTGIRFDNVTNAYVGSSIFSFKNTAVQWENVNTSLFVENEIVGNTDNGVSISNSYNCKVERNHIDGNNDYLGTGIRLSFSYYCDVVENEVSRSFTGIMVSSSRNCTLQQNILHDFDYGPLSGYMYPTAISVSNSPNCTIIQNSISESPTSGIFLDFSMGPHPVECRNNLLSGCGFLPWGLMPGMYGISTEGDLVNDKPVLYIWNQTGLNIDGLLYGQVLLHEAKFCSITGGEFNEASAGVYLSYSTNCTVESAESSGNGFAGAFMYSCANCTFNSLVLEANSRVHSLTTVPASVWVFGSQNSRVMNCEISDSQGAGLMMAASPSTVMKDNVFQRNGIVIMGMGMPTAGDYYFIEQNNTINGKQFGYFFNETDLTVDGSLYGQILVVNSSKVDVVGGDFSEVTSGVSFVLSENCSLEGATIKDNSLFPLQIILSESTTIIDSSISENPFLAFYNPYSEATSFVNTSVCRNGYSIPENQYSPMLLLNPYDELSYSTFSQNRYGIQVQGDNITLHKNNISCNGIYGIYVTGGNYFNISSNRISGNYVKGQPGEPATGIVVSGATNGVIHNNSIYSNTGYGIMAAGSNSMIYWNEIGWNGLGNAVDAGTSNLWDDNVTTGNAWSDYIGSGTYPILMSSSVDRYPRMLTDSATPTLDSPDDEQFEAGTFGNEIVWHASDDYPGHFVVYQNGTVIANQTWCFEPIEVELEALVVGVHNLTIVVYDSAGNHVIDTVIVEAVDTITPTIDSPEDIEYVVGSTGNSIVWHGSDLFPASYEIFIDTVSSKTGDWNSSVESITVNVDGLSAGEYNYTVVLTDEGGNSVSDTVMVVVTEGPTTPTTTPTLPPITTTPTPTSPPPNSGLPPMTIMLALVVAGVFVILIVVVFRMKR